MSNSEPAPYAPVHNVLSVIRRLRDKGLPNPLSQRELERVGVPEGNAPRTLAALRFLGLVNEDGFMTAEFQRLGKASTVEYPIVLAEILRAAYSGVFTIVDPVEDDEIAIHDAFRHYSPPAQRNRMVTLFLGLCREAEIVPGGPPVRKAKMRRSTSAKPVKQTAAINVEVLPAKEPESDGLDYRLIAGLMQRLPESGRWTRSQRDKWLQAVAANVDLMIEVEEFE